MKYITRFNTAYKKFVLKGVQPLPTETSGHVQRYSRWHSKIETNNSNN